MNRVLTDLLQKRYHTEELSKWISTKCLPAKGLGKISWWQDLIDQYDTVIMLFTELNAELKITECNCFFTQDDLVTDIVT